LDLFPGTNYYKIQEKKGTLKRIVREIKAGGVASDRALA
jgi:hypothetical protein